jgi:outer membrane protein OmpA-like peptidoglycan-associated protein
MDTEDLLSLTAAGPEGLEYSIHMSAPGRKLADEELKKFKLTRKVRHEDLEQSSRMTLLYSSSDPESYGGQTFAETSTKVLAALKSSGETPFVFGPYTGLHGVDSAMPASAPPPAATSGSATGAPLVPDMGAMFGMLFGSARHYYRGTLKRVEPGDVPYPVLLNGVRTTLQAVHAAGDFRFPDEDPVHVEVWWLDNPTWVLTLKYTFGPGSSVITRIDIPVGDNSGAAGQMGGLAAQLAGKSCRAELHGVYFNSGSATLLDESEPMLKNVAAAIKSTGDSSFTIEGHTDNIGSAQYNLTLSEQRAEAVRAALVTRYGVPAARLSAKGFGLTRPVETNDTYEGRAHNRRVELVRACPGAH